MAGNVSERRKVLEAVNKDNDLLAAIKRDPEANKLYQQVLESKNLGEVADKTWEDFKVAVLGNYVELHPISSVTKIGWGRRP